MTKPAFKYSLDSILPYVRQSLGGVRAYAKLEFVEFANQLWSTLEAAEIPEVYRNPPQRGYDQSRYEFNRSPLELRFAATEAFNYLHAAGFTMRIPEEHTASFYIVPGGHATEGYFITARGAKWAASAEPVPEDSEAYMEHLHRRVPKLDAVIKEYVSEGLSAFVRGNDFSAAVMVGAAAEKAIYLLADSLKSALSDTAKQSRLQNLITEARSLKKLFDFVITEIKRGIHRDIIPYNVHEGVEPHIGSLIEAIRVQRNDAVHPQNARVTPDSVRLSYQAFPAAVEKIEKLRDWCHANTAAL
jgi:hypothetical protein